MPLPRVEYVISSFGFGFVGVASFVWGIVLSKRGDSTACITFLQWTLISMSLVFMVVFLTECCGIQKSLVGLYSYIGATSMILFVFFCLMIVAFAAIPIKPVKYPGLEKVSVDGISVYPVREYNLGDYGGWLRLRMADRRYWAKISNCLRHRHACDGMSPLVRDRNTGALLAERTSKKSSGLSPVESGCCKPPLACGFTYVNQTTWRLPDVSTNSADEDCSRWNNDQEKLCFQCDACKAGVLADVQRAWSTPVIVLFTGLVVQIVILCVVCNRVARFENAMHS